MLKDQAASEVFNSLVSITLGDGAKTLFWKARWIRGAAANNIAPQVTKLVSTQCTNMRTVQLAVQNHRWVNDIVGNLSPRGWFNACCFCRR
jgi:hypothetical protein